jgi:hypothetical protein
MVLPASIVACLTAISGCGRPSNAIDASSGVPPVAAEMTSHRVAAPAHTLLDEGVQSQVEGTALSAMLRLARARARVGDTIELSVSLKVVPLWEIGTLDASSETTATRLELDLPNWLEAQGAWYEPPPGRSHRPGGGRAYADEAVFKRKLVVKEGAAAGEHPVQCRVTYQACDDRQCLRPAAILLEVPLHIE